MTNNRKEQQCVRAVSDSTAYRLSGAPGISTYRIRDLTSFQNLGPEAVTHDADTNSHASVQNLADEENLFCLV